MSLRAATGRPAPCWPVVDRAPMRKALIVALVFSSACVKRIAPSAGEDRTALSGVVQHFGQDQEVPEGTKVTWEFGDGTPPVSGPGADHAFPRAGAFTVTQIITDRDGQERRSTAHATVLRRSVPMAIPADARAALILAFPWNRIAVHQAVATRLALRPVFDETERAFNEALGFDSLDPAQALLNGFDPDEGVALFTVPQDPEALVAAVGTSDDAKSLAAVRRMLTHVSGAGKLAGGPFTLSESKLADGTPIVLGTGGAGEKIGVLQRYGYLYLRTAGATDPLRALESVGALPPDKGLSIDPVYLATVKQVGTGDVVFYSHPAGPAPADDGARSKWTDQLGASAFALTDKDEQIEVRLFTQLRNLTGQPLSDAFKALQPPPDLAERLPAGPAAYLRLSASPTALWHELVRSSGADAARLRERTQEMTGADLEKELLPAFTGNLGIAVYLDAASLVEAVLGEQVGSFDRSSFLVAAELAPGKAPALLAALDRAIKTHPADDRIAIDGGGAFYRLGEGLQVAVTAKTLYLSLGAAPRLSAEEAAPPKPAKEKPVKKKGKAAPPPPPPEVTAASLGPIGSVLLPEPNAAMLSSALKKAGLGGFELASEQVAWLDIRSIVHSVEKAGADQGGIMGTTARLLSERFSGLRDALVEVRPSHDGLDASLYIRFNSKSAAPSGSK